MRALVLLLLLLNLAMFGWYMMPGHEQRPDTGPPLPGKGSLRLVKETGLPAQPVSHDDATVADLRVCWRSEPMAPGQRVSDLSSELRLEGFTIERRAAVAGEGGGVLVKVAERDTLQAAAETIQGLNDKGITGASAMPADDGRLMIIAGHYISRDDAVARQKALAAKGVQAELVSQERVSRRIRLIVSRRATSSPPSMGRWERVNCQAGNG